MTHDVFGANTAQLTLLQHISGTDELKECHCAIFICQNIYTSTVCQLYTGTSNQPQEHIYHNRTGSHQLGSHYADRSDYF